MTADPDPAAPLPDEVDRLALARLWPLDTDGAGWWRWTSPDLAVRDSYVDPPHDDCERWSAKRLVSPDGAISGEMEAR